MRAAAVAASVSCVSVSVCVSCVCVRCVCDCVCTGVVRVPRLDACLRDGVPVSVCSAQPSPTPILHSFSSVFTFPVTMPDDDALDTLIFTLVLLLYAIFHATAF